MLNFGKSARGKVVHIISEDRRVFSALCDKKQTGLVIDKSFTPKDVTCAKCRQYKIFKNALAEEGKEEKVKHDLLVAETAKEKKKKEDKKKAKPVPVEEPVLNFQKEKKTDGSFQIIHVPSGLHFFDKIEEKVIDRALSRLNDIETEWAINGKMPKDFISQCRKALRIAYNQSGIKIPDGLIKEKDPVEESKKEKKIKKKVIKRRDKKEKGVKKERIKKERVTKKKDKKKTKKQIVYEFIQDRMIKGISISDLIVLLKKEFGFSSKKATPKIRGKILRMRKEGIEIMVRLTEKKEDDFYKIVG